jgi:hypothetical protein
MKLVASILLLLNAGFLLGFLLSTEDGGDKYFRNICWLLQHYDRTLPNHRCENLKSFLFYVLR